MKYYDITIPLSSNTIPWPGDQRFVRQEGPDKDIAIVSKLTMSSHSGTHIDAPKHFLVSRHGIDHFDLEALVGQFTVAGVKSKSLISLADVKKLAIKPGMRVLFKTRNHNLLAKKKFTADYVSLSLEAAKYLVSKKIKLVGIDYMGIEAKAAPGHPVHKTLLAGKVVIAEGLHLKNIKPGKYSGAILPLLIKDGDGAPARAVLWK
jgi:arylformamidase